MARGNDAANAAADLKQYGEHENAEQLIHARRANVDLEVDRASRKEMDEGATDALDLSKLPVEKDERIIAASVRGGKVIAVVERLSDGRQFKRALDVPEHAAKAATGSKRQGGPKTIE